MVTLSQPPGLSSIYAYNFMLTDRTESFEVISKIASSVFHNFGACHHIGDYLKRSIPKYTQQLVLTFMVILPPGTSRNTLFAQSFLPYS